jgi:hypothetical protein
MKNALTKAQADCQSKRTKPYGFKKKLFILTVGGGAAFWTATLVTSVLPIAAKYRAAFSNWSIQTVWAASLPMGLIIGFCVSYSLLSLFTENGAKDPILKTVIISAAALAAAELLVDVPMALHASSDAIYYFFIGLAFNAARFLFLGITVGYLYKRLYC